MTDTTTRAAVKAGIDHFGISVPDIEAATEFFKSAFGAEVLFDFMDPDADPNAAEGEFPVLAHKRAAAEDLSEALGVPVGAQVRRIRKLGFDGGPMIELFQWETNVEQKQPSVATDMGLHHFAIWVDDVYETAERIKAAGGRALPGGPVEMFGLESGERNRAWYTQTPWGMTIEIISYPSEMPYEQLINRPAVGRHAYAAH